MSSSEPPRSDGVSTSGIAVVPDGPAQLIADAFPAYATWGQRVLAAILDNAILAGVTWLALGAGFQHPTLTPGIGANGDGGRIGDPLLLIPVGTLVILLVLQAVTGWTPGKLVVGIRVVREDRPGPAGLWTTLSRWVLHLLDAILLIGYLRPLWHEKRQTFADTIAHTVVLQAVPDLPRRPRITLHAAAVVTVVLGIGYGYVPIAGSSTEPVTDLETCTIDGAEPALTTGDITVGGSVSIEQERRLWTVRETRTAHPTATTSWASEPSARDVDYRIVLSARSLADRETPPVSQSWDVGANEEENWSEGEGFSHTRTISPDGDVHVADVELTDSEAMARLGTDLHVSAQLLADGEVVAECGGP